LADWLSSRKWVKPDFREQSDAIRGLINDAILVSILYLGVLV
jgi:hypothetical protein